MSKSNDLFVEISGKLDGFTGPNSLSSDAVVLSNISHGAHFGTKATGTGIKYVARGTEYYTIQGRTYPVKAGQFMCVSQNLSSVVEVKRTGDSTLGMCMFIRSEADEDGSTEVERPLVFSASCSALGGLLGSSMKKLTHPAADRALLAKSLLGSVRSSLDPLLEDTCRALDALDSLRPSTRYETLRKLEIARGHLHQITDRQVELAELAAVAGVSRFQLLRNFRDCYGAPPATYHRRVRLKLAKQEIDGKRMTCGEAAHRFGFADASSFSHAYRRTFGEAPIRALGNRPVVLSAQG